MTTLRRHNFDTSCLVCIWWYIGDVRDWMGTWHVFVYFNVVLKINSSCGHSNVDLPKWCVPDEQSGHGRHGREEAGSCHQYCFSCWPHTNTSPVCVFCLQGEALVFKFLPTMCRLSTEYYFSAAVYFEKDLLRVLLIETVNFRKIRCTNIPKQYTVVKSILKRGPGWQPACFSHVRFFCTDLLLIVCDLIV